MTTTARINTQNVLGVGLVARMAYDIRALRIGPTLATWERATRTLREAQAAWEAVASGGNVVRGRVRQGQVSAFDLFVAAAAVSTAQAEVIQVGLGLSWTCGSCGTEGNPYLADGYGCQSAGCSY